MPTKKRQSLPLITRDSDNPVIAPVLLSRVTDCLANQDLIGAHDLLSKLIEKFPRAPLAWQARIMLSELE